MAARGDHAAAEAEYRDVLAARLRVLGPDHPSTLTTRHQIAREWRRGVITPRPRPNTGTARRPTAGARPRPPVHADHPATRSPGDGGAGDPHAAAEAEYRDVLAARLRVQGPDHPSTLPPGYQIAREMAARGDHAARRGRIPGRAGRPAAGAGRRPPGHADHPAPDRPGNGGSGRPRRGRSRPPDRRFDAEGSTSGWGRPVSRHP